MAALLDLVVRNRAGTRPDHADRRLRSRRYPVPFARVWEVVRTLAGESSRWRTVEIDVVEGVVRAEARTRLMGWVDDVEIRVGLDANGRTRVDMTSTSRVGVGDLGANKRRIRRFLRTLDGRLGPTRTPSR